MTARARLPHASGLDSALARLSDELNAASCRDDISAVLHFHGEWIARLSKRGRERLLEVAQDIATNKNFHD
jgi:hypothetical protein